MSYQQPPKQRSKFEQALEAALISLLIELPAALLVGGWVVFLFWYVWLILPICVFMIVILSD